MDERLSATTPDNQQPVIPAAVKRGNKWILGAAMLFFFLFAIFIAYGSQQAKVTRLNKEITSLKVELNALKPAQAAGQASNSNSSTGNGLVFGDVQLKARNSERVSDMASLQTQLEAYFSQNGYYPSRTDMNSATWLAANMKSLGAESLTDPSNPTSSTTLVAVPAANFYAYVVSGSNDSSCEADDTKCAKYDLTANFEGTVNGSKTYVKSNLD